MVMRIFVTAEIVSTSQDQVSIHSTSSPRWQLVPVKMEFPKLRVTDKLRTANGGVKLIPYLPQTYLPSSLSLLLHHY